MENIEKSSQQDIIDLLFLALYQDDHLSIEEDSMLQRALKFLGWQENEASGPSVGQAYAAVREANSSDAIKETFLRERTSRIKENGHSTLAFEWLGKILASDGLDREEKLFMDRVEKLLFD